MALGGRYGFVDRRGKWAVAPVYDGAWPFVEDRAAVLVKGKLGFLSLSGETAVEPRYDPVLGGKVFSGGVSGVALQGLWGFIDSAGDWAVEPSYKATQ